MDSSLSAENQPAASAPARRRALGRFLAVTVVVLLALVLAIVFLNSSQPPVTFLTPEQLNQALKPSAFTRLKDKLVTLIPSFLRPVGKKHPDLVINSFISVREADFSFLMELGAPTATNAAGVRVWVIPSNSGLLRKVAPDSHPYFGLTASLFATNNRPVHWRSYSPLTNDNTSEDWGYPVTDFTFMPVTNATSVNLTFKTTELFYDYPFTNVPSITTFVDVAGRAVIPDGGGIVINCGHTNPANNINYWLLITPQLLDASGKPIRRPNNLTPQAGTPRSATNSSGRPF